MLSLTQFRKHCYPVFKLMRDTNIEVEIAYHGKVYVMTIRETDKKPEVKRVKQKLPSVIRQIDTEVCENCGSLVFNNVCMNSKCTFSNPIYLDVRTAQKTQEL